MQASETNNPLSCYSKASRRERFLHVLHHVCSHACMRSPRVCMRTPQCKSRLATGCFLFMWCGALVYKGTLRFWCSLALWLFGLMLQPCPWVTLLGGWAAPPPNPSRPLSWDRVGQMPGALSHTKSLHTWTSFVPSFINLLLKACFSSQSAALDFLFLLQLWKVCLFHAVSFSSVSSNSGTEVTVFKDGLGSEFKDLCRASYLLLPDGLFIPHFLTSWGLLLVWAFPPFTVSYP